MSFKRLVKMIGLVLAAEVLGSLGSLVTAPAISGWYATLAKPAFTPPNWLFAPVWTTLFALMGIAAFLIWEAGIKKKAVQGALKFFAIQFGLNILWSFVFFGARQPAWALVEIVILWAFILVTLIKFYRLSKPAGLMLLPYLAWVTLATLLNLGIVLLN